MLRRFPLFYTPFFYHSLEKEPRRSGFLTPSPGHSSIGGFMLGLGCYWAINRSYDMTYRVVDYVSRGYAHHIDLRGKPRPGTDYDVIFYGVQDRGAPNSGNPPQKYGGMSFYAIGKSDLGDGWEARVLVNYISSFRFRQGWTQSYNEAIGSEIHSTAFIHKDFSTFTFDGVFSRLQNYENLEQLVTDPATGSQHYETDAVTIRKLPEVDFGTRDVQIRPSLPLWFSFDSSAGLLSRSEPYFQTDSTTGQETVSDRFQTGNFMSRVNVAPHVTTAFHWGSFNLVPSLGFQETFYSEAQTPYEDHYQVVGANIVRSARDFSLNLIFPTLSRVFNKKTLFGDKLKHVIEPRVTYHYVTGVGDDFNRFIRFDETDLLANTNEVEISLTNRIYAKRGDSVQEIFTWEVAQKRYFDPTFGGALVSGERNVFASTADLTGYAFLVGPRNASPVVSMLRISPIAGLAIRWLADYDPREKGISDSSFALDYYKKKFQFFGRKRRRPHQFRDHSARRPVPLPDGLWRPQPPRMELRGPSRSTTTTSQDPVHHRAGSPTTPIAAASAWSITATTSASAMKASGARRSSSPISDRLGPCASRTGCSELPEPKLPEHGTASTAGSLLEKVKGPELGISGPALRELAVGGDSPPGMLSVLEP